MNIFAASKIIKKIGIKKINPLIPGGMNLGRVKIWFIENICLFLPVRKVITGYA
jgi:hypothetical protein